jgi:hydroxymethylbilane synthase
VQRDAGRTVQLVEITSQGDVEPGDLTQLGGIGVFTAALRRALLDGDVDLVVHSLKDLPVGDADGITLAAVPEREDARDVLVCPSGWTLGELAPGSRVGTGSPRRAAQLHALGLGLDVVPVRGNVDTRIKLAESGEVEAVVLARAGLARIDRLDAVTEVLDPVQMLPAPGQGALAVECRSREPEVTELLAGSLEHPASRAAVVAERAVLSGLSAGCSSPIGALADIAEDDTGTAEIYLRAVVAAPDGSAVLRRSATGPMADAEQIGRRLAGDLLADGARTVMGTG